MMNKRFKYKILIFQLIILCIGCSSSVNTRDTHSICSDYAWSDIEQLAQPHLDDFMHTQLVMQGQSSNYKASAAARHILAMAPSLPQDIQTTLHAIIEADC